jgi:hypothetical protein
MHKFITSLCIIALLFSTASRAMDSKSAKLLEAAQDGKLLKVKMLLAFGANVNAKDSHGNTSLMLAATYGHEAVCRLLIEKNAKVNGKDNFGLTPLHHAIQHRQKEVCELLNKNNASLDEKDIYGRTPLKIALVDDNEAASKFLIRAQLGRLNAPIITFLGIVRKRKKNLSCEIQYDVAKMIARMIFDPGAVRTEKLNIKAEIDKWRALKEAMYKDRIDTIAEAVRKERLNIEAQIAEVAEKKRRLQGHRDYVGGGE